jgi:hypothetical protein
MAIRNIAYIGSFGMVAALNYGAYRRKTSLAGTKKRAIRLILILMTLIAAMDMAVALDSTGEIGSYLLGRGADAGTANVIVKTDYNADGSTAGWREYSCDKNGNTLSVKYCDADGSVYFTGYSAE